MATLHLPTTLPPPPRFGSQGPETTDDWVVFYRWLQSFYAALLLATNNSGQAVTYPSVNIPPAGLRIAYVINALPTPMVIPAGVHGQGPVFIVQCWSGPLVGGAPTGTLVTAEVDLDPAGTGDVTIIYSDGAVGSVVIQR